MRFAQMIGNAKFINSFYKLYINFQKSKRSESLLEMHKKDKKKKDKEKEVYVNLKPLLLFYYLKKA